MKKSKLKSSVLQITAILLFFATAFGITAGAAGLFDVGSDSGNDKNPLFEQLFRPGTQAPSDSQDDPAGTTDANGQPTDPEQSGISAGYVQNLSNAFNTGLIQGYLKDRTSASLTQRVEMYNLLTSAIATVDSAVSPVTYQSYTADGYQLVRRLQLNFDYTAGTETIIRYSKKQSNTDASYTIIANPYLVGRKTVQSYMGYLIISRVEYHQIYVPQPPATETTDAPTTIPPATTSPAPNTPTTGTPSTGIPSTTLPATGTPTTGAPSTNAPSTNTPATGTPVTTAPSTSAPVTVPATSAPTTIPSTEAPSTQPVTTPTTAGVTTPLTKPSEEPAETNTPSAASAAPGETVAVTILSIYDRNGNLLVDDIGSMQPYFARDYSNRPVFKDEDGQLYAFDGKNFIAITQSNLRSELPYDYPAYPLGEYKKNYEAYYDATTDGYHYINYTDGSTVVAGNYRYAFNFGPEGYAIVLTETDNILQVIKRSTSQVFKPGKQYTFYVDPNTGKKQYVKDYYAFPSIMGIESIGASGFDNGYLRLRIITSSMMSDSLGKVVLDKDYLVDTTGAKFPIPEGYTLEGYSDGILLLRSMDGLYGYYSIQGDWIAQPLYTYARPFIQGLAVLGSENGTVGMIDTKGNIVLPFVYTSIEDVSSGLIVTYCEGIGYETYELVKK